MISTLEVVMALPFTPLSNQRNNQPRIPLTEFEPLLDSIEAAALLRIHPNTLKKMARRGEIEARRIGRCWRFRNSDLNEWLWRQERGGYRPRVL
jgi:excisionase family DNA binding protein